MSSIHGTGPLSDLEQGFLNAMLPELKASIEKGVKFAKAWTPK